MASASHVPRRRCSSRSRYSPRSARRPRPCDRARADRPPGAGARHATPERQAAQGEGAAREGRGEHDLGDLEPGRAHGAAGGPAGVPRLREKGLEIVALAIDENSAEVREFWRKRGYSFPVAMRSDAFFDALRPRQHDADVLHRRPPGNARHRVAGTVGPEKLEALFRPLLAEEAPAARIAKK